MQLIRLIVVLVVLIPRIRSSNISINIDKANDFATLGDAAIQILTTCPATKTKTIAIDGDFPGDFMNKLSTIPSFALVTSDEKRRSANNIARLNAINLMKTHKVDVFVAISADPRQFHISISNLIWSHYDNPSALILLIVWPKKKYTQCNGKSLTAKYFHVSKSRNHLKTVLMCHDRKNGIMMYTYNPFTNKMPKPWQRIPYQDTNRGFRYSYFVQKYQKQNGNCENLDFDKTHDLGGTEVKVVIFRKNRVVGYHGLARESPIKEIMIWQKSSTYIYNFIAHANGKRRIIWRQLHVGKPVDGEWDEILAYIFAITSVPARRRKSITYPHGEGCTYIVSHFRGHKSQLQKMIDIIDVYSWMGVGLVYLLSLVFLKYFFRQPLMTGILNLIRLSCNCGIITSSPTMASQMYMGCLLFVVVTMQGIFMGNLAALLTHDFPVRQADTVQDLADFRYTVYVHPAYRYAFNNSAFEGRVIWRKSNDDCIPNVKGDAMVACVTTGPEDKHRALQSKLYVSSNCIDVRTYTYPFPLRWPLKERLHKVHMWSFATDIMLPLKAIVAKKRLREEESQEIVLEPTIMVFSHLHFAFNILGIGLTCASVCFISELIIDRYDRRVMTTRVIVLNEFEIRSTWISRFTEFVAQRFARIFR